MTYRIFVDGQEGTTGLRIHEMLARRSDVEVLRIDATGAQAIVLSGTNLVTFPVIGEIEAATGLPVVSSNQALLWSALRKAGVTDDVALGRLFTIVM